MYGGRDRALSLARREGQRGGGGRSRTWHNLYGEPRSSDFFWLPVNWSVCAPTTQPAPHHRFVVDRDGSVLGGGDKQVVFLDEDEGSNVAFVGLPLALSVLVVLKLGVVSLAVNLL